ncbi:MAG: SDR family oxidoreductase [Erysipelotrichaceae bacterium]|nr:SDR family oxidoreductase [Erysipelotrichaceae bacterium]
MKTILVTGGSHGIGKAICNHLLSEGHTVIIVDIDEAAGSEICKDYVDRCTYINADLSTTEGVIELFKQTDRQHISIDAIINNAGKGMVKNLIELTDEDIEDGYGLMLRAPLLISREWVKRRELTTIGYGRIINIASTRASMSEPHGEVYAMCKGGLVSLTHALANSLQPYNIQVNSISPGWIVTKDIQLSDADHFQHLSNRTGYPKDIVKAIDYLLLEDNSFINGQNIVIDGGMTKKMIYVE